MEHGVFCERLGHYALQGLQVLRHERVPQARVHKGNRAGPDENFAGSELAASDGGVAGKAVQEGTGGEEEVVSNLNF